MDFDFTVKQLDPADLQESLALVWKVFLEFEAPDYSHEGIQEFKQFIRFSSIRQQLLEHQFQMWTCSDHHRIVGVLAVRPVCHISLLFVDRQYHQQGIARSLLREMTESLKGSSCSEVTVNSSPFAVEVYHKLGFTATDVEQTVNGIRFTPMRRPL